MKQENNHFEKQSSLYDDLWDFAKMRRYGDQIKEDDIYAQIVKEVKYGHPERLFALMMAYADPFNRIPASLTGLVTKLYNTAVYRACHGEEAGSFKGRVIYVPSAQKIQENEVGYVDYLDQLYDPEGNPYYHEETDEQIVLQDMDTAVRESIRQRQIRNI